MPTTLNVRNPRTGEINYHITPWSSEDIKQTTDVLRAAQKDWLALGLKRRCQILSNFADLLEQAKTNIIKALSVDTGRLAISEGEYASVIANCRIWAVGAPDLVPKLGWQQGRTKPNFKHSHDFVPYSLLGVISPWNFPMALSFIDAIPALLAGACVVIKPSEVTPRFADALIPIIEKSKLKNILKFIQGDGETGAALIDHVDCICFTGSVPTGRKVAVRAAKNLIPANLELGGKDPLIITENTNIEVATSLALRASVLATGQACQSIERVYVPNSVHDAFIEKLMRVAKPVKLDYPKMGDGQIGPFIFAKQADIVAWQIADAVNKGAKVLTGGKILEHGGGRWLEPTVITQVNHDMVIMREETFGPVIPVMGYDRIEEAIHFANDTTYGLSGGVFAASIEEAHEIGRHIDAGAISLMDAALTVQYFEAGKQSFKNSGLGPSRMGQEGFLRFFRQKAYIANTIAPLSLKDFTG